MTSAARSEELTFVFTDIEGSTGLARELGSAWPGVLALHHRMVRTAIAAAGGTEISNTGDGLFVTFPAPRDAAVACIEAQRALRAHDWPTPGGLPVRMGMHVGSAVRVGPDVIGLAVHQAARVAAAAHGGQILLSGAAAARIVPGPSRYCLELGAFRLKDFDEPQLLHELVDDDLPRTATTARAPSALEGRLPSWRTTLFGRDELTQQVADLIVDLPLVTLVGPGGAGKTRVAVAAAALAASAFGHDVSFVDLAAVDDAALVPTVAAQALQLRLESLEPTIAIRDQLHGRHALVVLDNCEHLLDATAELAELLLAASARIHLLTTSREPLGMTEERTVPVGPLTTSSEADELSSSPAWALFVARLGRDIEPDERADAQELLSVLDGLPLAVELAAGAGRRVGVAGALRQARLGPSALVVARGGALRHRSLAAAIDWSHRLLDPDEQAVLRRLSIFQGGFTEELAAQVAGGHDIPADRVAPAFHRLVESSLVSAGSGRPRRFRLLELVGAYAQEKLVGSGERDSVRSAHLAAMSDVAEAQDADAYERIDVELANVRAALAFAVEQENAGGVRLAAAMSSYWDLRGHWNEARFWLERSTAAAPDTPWTASALVGLAGICRRMADHAAAEAAATTALSLAPDSGVEARALIAIGNVARTFHRYDEAELAFTRALELASSGGYHGTGVMALQFLSGVEYERRDLHAATALARQALERARAADDDLLLGPSLNNLGTILVSLDRLDEGRALLQESLTVRRRMRDVRGEAATLLNLADLMHGKGEYAESIEMAHASFDLFMGLGEQLMAAAAAGNIAGTLLALGNAYGACVLLGLAVDEQHGYAPYVRQEYEDALARAVQLLTPETARAALEQGTELGLHAALEQVLTVQHP